MLKQGLASRNAPDKKEPGGKEERTDTFVGVIESVNPEQQFVLVRMEQRLTLAAGTRLETRATNGLRSELMVSPERKLNFLAADIINGLPHAGDIVVIPIGQITTPGSTPGRPGATPGQAEPILTAEPPGQASQPGASPSDPIPGVPPVISVPGPSPEDPIPGVPPAGYSRPLPR